MAEPAWHLWKAFLSVMRHGSLSAAARDLSLTQPTLGRQILALESALGVALFTRSTDGLRPTDRALALAPQAEAMASAAAGLMRTASGQEDALLGIVRVAASEFMGGIVLPPMLARFHHARPGIHVELSLSDRTEDLLRYQADLAVRNVAPTQAALVARRIGEVPVRLYAHRDYVRTHGMPGGPEELATHTLLAREEHAHRMSLLLGIERPSFCCNSELALQEAIRCGYGIGYCHEAIGRQNPALISVLPDFVLATVGIWLVMHEDLRRVSRIRVLFDHLADELVRYVGPGTEAVSPRSIGGRSAPAAG